MSTAKVSRVKWANVRTNPHLRGGTVFIKGPEIEWILIVKSPLTLFFKEGGIPPGACLERSRRGKGRCCGHIPYFLEVTSAHPIPFPDTKNDAHYEWVYASVDGSEMARSVAGHLSTQSFNQGFGFLRSNF